VVNTALGGIESRDCGLQFQQQQGGNRNLKPETSKAWTVGGAWQPTAATNVGLDYWSYKVSDSIGPTGEEVIFGNPTLYADLFIRCGMLSAAEAAKLSNVCGGQAAPTTLAYIINGQLNLGNYKTSGIDFSASWQGDATKYGRFNAGYRATYILNYEYQLEKGAVYNDNLGIYFNGNPVAKYIHVLNFGWQYGAWSTQLAQRFSSGYTDQNTDVNDNPRHVSSNNTWDLAVTWAPAKGVSLTGGITNLFDNKPPFSNQGDGFQVGYDYRYANPIGRAILMRASYEY
jgi:iron complex outermembrane receptor protein